MKNTMEGVCLFTICLCLFAVPNPSSGESTDDGPEWPVQNPEIYFLHVTSHIQYRFATTHVVSKLANNAEDAKEATFSVRLPKAAFISNFSMEIDGQVYPGNVKEKSVAKKEYDQAKDRGQSAGHVSAQARNTNVFKISVNVAAGSKVIFNLTYQELLQRRLGIYEHVISIEPKQVVRDLQVKVNIHEIRALTTLKVPPLRTSAQEIWNQVEENPSAVITRSGPNVAHISYKPGVQEQLEASENGVAGQFIVQYDIERELDAGEIHVVDGYFVHFFAPSGLEPVPKNVLFVLDVSGSMSGTKLQQTKDAMATILDELRSVDRFNFLQFSNRLDFWNSDDMVDTSANNIQAAKEYIATMKADGGTNINDALLRGIDFLRQQEKKTYERRTSIVIFLTDGEPTAGITNLDQILANVKRVNKDLVTLFSLGFGSGVDFKFLQKTSLQNRGFARRIYEDSDADLQLQGFYSEVANPTLSDVLFKYLDDVVDTDSVTKTEFPNYFGGTELIVAGKLTRNRISTFPTRVEALTASGDLELDVEVNVDNKERGTMEKFTEKLWAYLTIRKLLSDMVESDNSTLRGMAKARALGLSLKYHFVTPLTSMVVVKPDDTTKTDAGEDEEDDDKQGSGRPPRRPTLPKPARRPNQRRPPSSSFVDNDPHFLVSVMGLEEAVCFDIQGTTGQIYQLIHDHQTDTVVNGYVIEEDVISPTATKHKRTYFGKIAILHNKISILFTPDKITINGKTHRWKEFTNTSLEGVRLAIDDKADAIIDLGDGLIFNVLRHRASKYNPRKVDYLGFYIQDGGSLSRGVHGLLGQFQHMSATIVDNTMEILEDTHSKNKTIIQQEISFSRPNLASVSIRARLGHRRNMSIREHVSCWFMGNNGQGLIQGSPRDYLVPWIEYTGSSLRYRPLKKKKVPTATLR